MFSEWLDSVAGFFEDLGSYFTFFLDFLADISEAFYDFLGYIAEAVSEINFIVQYLPAFVSTAIVSYFTIAIALRVVGR